MLINQYYQRQLVTMGNPKRIRSNYQRRVLDWLTDGGGTVSDVARALNLRMPHASAALKQLRESGDVVPEPPIYERRTIPCF